MITSYLAMFTKVKNKFLDLSPLSNRFSLAHNPQQTKFQSNADVQNFSSIGAGHNTLIINTIKVFSQTGKLLKGAQIQMRGYFFYFYLHQGDYVFILFVS